MSYGVHILRPAIFGNATKLLKHTVDSTVREQDEQATVDKLVNEG
jgi:hypothetical protein